MTQGYPEPSVHKLADDARRTWLASGAGIVVGLLAVGTNILLARSDLVEYSPLLTQVLAMGTSFVAMFVVYLVTTWRVFASSDGNQLRAWIAATNPTSAQARRRQRWLQASPVSWLATAALLALGVVAVVALSGELRSRTWVLLVAVLLVIAAWCLVVVSGAVMLLRADTADRGLRFPGTEQPVWGDFVYLAVQLSTTFSSSDVEVTSTALRRKVTVQSLIAFVFNTVIVALLVSVLVSAA